MQRRFIAIILLFIAISLLIAVPVLAFTPLGANLLDGSAQPTAIATFAPTFLPFTPTPTPKPTPVLTVRGSPPAISANEAILEDNDTGHILYDLNGERPQPMASTTKIMTAVIAIQTASLDMLITVHQDAVNEVSNNGGSSAQLHAGEQLTLRDLLYGLLVPSGDDAAIAIADALGGNAQNFVHEMNLYAYRLRLFQTHYINPDGLTYYDSNHQPIPGHYTTAYDLVRLAQYAMSLPLFAQIVSTQHYMIPATATHSAHSWDNTNTLLATYPGMTGIKTGYTLEAGGCLIFSATRSGHHLIGVVLHSIPENSRFSDSEILLNWGFDLPLEIPAV
ncbi:MAG TPA: serine hydrolase [Ktedonobacteraceae bacterium]|nr:serine hydrolase [Ktedonobacteraceae bacterium]